MTPKELRDKIEKLLGDLIGDYTYPNGQKGKAIAVLRGNETYPQKGTRVEGVEVLIFYPEVIPRPFLKGHYQVREFVIHLKQWDERGELVTTMDKLAEIEGMAIVRSSFSPRNARFKLPMGYRVVIKEFY